MAYNSPYQPNADRSEMRRMGMQAGRSILEKTIIWGAQIIKFVVQFIVDAIKQVFGQ